MQVITTRSALTPLLLQLRAQGHTIGFVPTMGALHEGHMSLIAESRKRATIMVASVFVNPTQFNDPKDLEKYPRQPEKDARMLEKAGCDYLYLPAVEDVYPEGTQKGPFFDFSGLDTRLEGASRPGHFAGVAQVVKVLVETSVPDFLFLGQKDYQQCMIVREMLRQMSGAVTLPSATDGHGQQQWTPEMVKLVICPIIREQNGLAMSSRNVRLTDEQRHRAAAIFATLKYAAALYHVLPTSAIEQICTDSLNALPDFKVDYFLLLDSITLQEINADTSDVVVITSVIVGGVRLLDNALISALQ